MDSRYHFDNWKETMLRIWRFRGFVACFATCLSAVILGCGGPPQTPPQGQVPPPEGPRPNLVIFLTDDQPRDTLWAMPVVQNRLASHGVVFSNALVTTPVCSPSRASLLSGGLYAQHTGVLTNDDKNGGAVRFDDRQTLATILMRQGYKTCLVGKYMHQYVHGYISPGWTRFVANNEAGTVADWFSFMVTVGGSGLEPGRGTIEGPVQQYITDYQRDRVLEFIDEHAEEPMLIVFSVAAPHDPRMYPDSEALKFTQVDFRNRRPSYGEIDMTDKPLALQEIAASQWPPANGKVEAYREALRSLQPVDRAVGAVVDRIEKIGKLDETVFFFTSDNGLMWGEHRYFGKCLPYEESLGVPLAIRMPGAAAATVKQPVAANLDLDATIFDLLNLPVPTDGESLLPLLRQSGRLERESLLLEHYEPSPLWPAPGNFGIWAGLRVRNQDGNWKYVEHPTGEKELYDLGSDPYELRNRHDDPLLQDLQARFAEDLADRKGLAILSYELPEGTPDKPYKARIEAWGGQPPRHWSVYGPPPPPGILIDTETGRLLGTPTVPGTYSFVVKTQVSSAPKPQVFLKEFELRVR